MFHYLRKVIQSATLAAALWACPALANSDVSGRVSMIQSYPGHTGLLIGLAQTYSSSEGCGGGVWYIFPDDSPRASFVQAMILSAQASRASISITISGCYQNYPRIVAVTLNTP
jgi:hypothetical protein